MKLKGFLLLVIVALLALPTLAQQTTTVRYGNFSFSVDSTWAGNIGIDPFAGDPTTLEQPGGPEVKHVQFLLSDSDMTTSMYDATLAIRLYNTADFAAYLAHQSTFEQLQGLLNTRTDLNFFTTAMLDDQNNTLPFLPVMPASQVIRSRARYIETAAVRGISYVTAYRQDVSPFVGGDFYYTFQGISTDGASYISVVARPTTGLFPAEMAADFNYEAFTAGIAEYMTQSSTTLNASLDTDFTPSLSAFDAVVMSFNFGGEMVVPVEPTIAATPDPMLGGLGGVNWTLISYGSLDAPIAPLPETPVTVTFGDQGVSGTAGCNTFSASFQYDNFDVGTLTIGTLVSTLMACAEPIMAQETAIMMALQAATYYEIIEGQLRITYPEGVLIFGA